MCYVYFATIKINKYIFKWIDILKKKKDWQLIALFN